MIFNEIKCHVNTSLGLVGGCIPPVSAPVHSACETLTNLRFVFTTKVLVVG